MGSGGSRVRPIQPTWPLSSPSTCASCGCKGTAVIRFGPEASAGEAILLRHLDDTRGPGLDVAEDAAR